MKRAPIIPLWQIAMAERATTTRPALYEALRAFGYGTAGVASACGVTTDAVLKARAYERDRRVRERRAAEARTLRRAALGVGAHRRASIALALAATRATVAAMRGAA